MFSLKGKVAIITGGGSGIGKATALTLAKQEASVVILDYNEESCRGASAEINAAGGKAIGIVTNVADEFEVKSAVESAAAKLGDINILVNSAGVSHIGNVLNTEVKDMDRLYEINIKGTYLLMKHTIPSMEKAGGGAIINLASIASVVGIADRFAYSMTKGAVLTMTLSVARDMISKGIRCNCISPGRVHTPFVDDFLAKNYPGQEQEMFAKLAASQPIGRMGTPDEMAALILYLVSDEASFITGSNYGIDGGFTGIRM